MIAGCQSRVWIRDAWLRNLSTWDLPIVSFPPFIHFISRLKVVEIRWFEQLRAKLEAVKSSGLVSWRRGHRSYFGLLRNVELFWHREQFCVKQNNGRNSDRIRNWVHFNICVLARYQSQTNQILMTECKISKGYNISTVRNKSFALDQNSILSHLNSFTSFKWIPSFPKKRFNSYYVSSSIGRNFKCLLFECCIFYQASWITTSRLITVH